VKQRALGSAIVTVVGCGDVSLPIASARGVDARDLAAALDRALEAGITLVDVAADADSERLAGDAIRAHRLRDTVTLATHVARGDIRASVEASLRATRLEVLPLVQLPLPTPPAELCMRLVREGKVLQWGLCVDAPPEPPPPAPPAPTSLLVTPYDIPAAPAPSKLAFEPWLVSLALPFSLCDRRAAPLLADPALPILARHPLAGGALAGTLGPGVKLALRDDRLAIDAATLERIALTLTRLVPFVRDVPPAARAYLDRAPRRTRDPEATTIAELALRYAIDRGAIVLPRLHRAEHVVDAVAAASAPPLSPDLTGQLNELSVS
jgi:aryl-alcohol dehydrogenase-like predicted oxidoreductase